MEGAAQPTSTDAESEPEDAWEHAAPTIAEEPVSRAGPPAPPVPSGAAPPLDEHVRLTCLSCGNKEDDPSSRFCSECGGTLDGSAPPITAGEAREPDGRGEPEPAVASATTAVPEPKAPQTIAIPSVLPLDGTLASPPGAAPRSRRRLAVVVGMVALVVGGGSAAALVATGTFGGKHEPKTLADAAFWSAANSALSPLAQADETAAENASTTDGALTRAADGGLIVRFADEASVHLRALSGLSEQQKGEMQLLLAFVAANRRYGQAFGAFTGTDNQSQLALDNAAAAARAATATAESGLSSDLRVPSQTAFISLRPASPPSSTTTAAPAPSDLAAVYVRQVDSLLSQSHAVVLALRSFVPRAASDAISRSAAVALARSYADQRRMELAQARALTAPPAFALAQGLLIRSLQASVADDQALVAWTVARRDGSENAQAALDRATRIGAQATALKRQFLRVYGQQRQALTRRSPATLPDIF